MKIGIIVATKAERKPFIDIFGEPSWVYPDKGYGACEVLKWKIDKNSSIHLICSGFGEIAAASSTQYLVDRHQVDMIVNYGVVGGLDEITQVGKIGYVSRAVHYDFDISASGHYAVGEYPGKGIYLRPKHDAIPQAIMKRYGLSEFTCASADKFVRAGESKKRLHKEFGADICEMEAAGIIITCNRNDVPVTLIKAVSDGVNEDSEAFDRNVYSSSLKCVNFIYEIIT